MPTALALRAHGGAVDAGIRSGQHLREDYQYHIVNAAMYHRVDPYVRKGAASRTPGAPAVVYHGRRGAAWLTLATPTTGMNFQEREGAASRTPGAPALDCQGQGEATALTPAALIAVPASTSNGVLSWGSARTPL